jgi:uncharacterized protein DUF3761/surface rod structure-forming protein G
VQKMKQWFKGLSATGKVASIAVASVLTFGTFSALAEPSSPSSVSPITTPTSETKPQPKIEKKTATTTEVVSFTSSTIEDSNLAQGTTQTQVAGVNGARTLTYEVTYTDGIETARAETASSITTPAVNEVVAKGTKVAPRVEVQPSQPSCPNGTYVNTYGNTVCRPYESSGAPAGASAQCEDGTYSFSQSRRGTCSGHGGVSVWL